MRTLHFYLHAPPGISTRLTEDFTRLTKDFTHLTEDFTLLTEETRLTGEFKNQVLYLVLPYSCTEESASRRGHLLLLVKGCQSIGTQCIPVIVSLF